MNYEQDTGKFYDGSVLVGQGWAGHEAGKNNHDMQQVHGVGPLPIGKYVIADPVEGTHLGPEAFPLVPDPSNEMFGRSAFYIHGASAMHPQMSSDGCIILARPSRDYIGAKIRGTPKDSPNRQLTVLLSFLGRGFKAWSYQSPPPSTSS